jgi:sugar phosphate isomerase/epimerase
MTIRPSSATVLSRRQFLSLTGMLPLALLAQSAGAPAGAPPVPESKPVPHGPRNFPIGIELYAVRGELARDLPGTLSAVAKMGYEAVEFYSPYYSWTRPYAKEVRSRLDDLGLRCYSTHNHIESFTPGEGIARAIELNQIIGARHLVLASAPKAAPGVEGWGKLCAQLSLAVSQLQPHGLSAGYHNHQAEWANLNGEQRILDYIAAHTPPEFGLQFDVGTCLEAGADPVAWIKANPGRIRSVHLKDWAPGAAAGEKGYRVLFGEGIAPWADIIAAAESVGGVEFYLMEQEGSRFSEFETAQRCLDSWRTLRQKA